MRRVLTGVCLLVLLANALALTTRAAEDGFAVAAELPGEGLEPVSPDTVDTTTTTSTVVPTTTAPPRPVTPPERDYHPEPVIVIGSIEVPKLALSVPLNQGISLHSIDRGPSHWPGTALPGRVGNTVIAGHRVTKTRPFRHIDTLVPGDEIIFTAAGIRSVYHVTEHEVVTPDAVWITNPTPDATATLFACHPPGSARYRYVVRASLVSTSPA